MDPCSKNNMLLFLWLFLLLFENFRSLSPPPLAESQDSCGNNGKRKFLIPHEVPV